MKRTYHKSKGKQCKCGVVISDDSDNCFKCMVSSRKAANFIRRPRRLAGDPGVADFVERQRAVAEKFNAELLERMAIK